jgi:hypothetical protein
MMRRTFVNLVALGMTLALARGAAAQDRDKAGSKDDRDSGQRHTVRGKVAGVTVVGETMVDYDTGQAVAAQVTYLTVLGSPRDGHHSGSADPNDQGKGDDKANKSSDKGGSGDASTGGSSDRDNVYLLAVTPRTKVWDKSSGQDGASSNASSKASASSKTNSGSNAQASDKDRGGAADDRAGLGRLEIGDRVDVEWMPLASADKSKDKDRASDSNSKGSKSQGYGRHRTFRGEALTITILHGDSSGSSESSRSNKGSSDKDKSSADSSRASK